MGDASIFMVVALVLTSLGSAVLALGLMGMFLNRSDALIDQTRQPEDQIVFMFDNHELCDATPAAHHMLSAGQAALDPWDRLLALLHQEFPELQERTRKLSDIGETILHGKDSYRRLEANWHKGLARIALIDEVREKQTDSEAAQAVSALSGELRTLQAVIDRSPLLVWKEDDKGAVRWANCAYLDLAATVLPDQTVTTWPLPKLFVDHGLKAGNENGKRLSINLPDGSTQNWFECTAQDVDGGILVFGILADPLVSAERTLKEFVQTLSKTFADLPTGLAIFDKNRQLALFNPALIDLTGLDALFLSTRPTLYAFLDQLRDKQRMPEPKNYKSWRQRIIALETAAVNGTYLEDWSLSTGQTYRVTGQPHPDGAVAFLFEDISAEVSVTRRFRSEVELGQSVIDSLPEAIAVFTASGVLTLSNKAYCDMWGSNPEESLGEINIVDATRCWQSQCDPTPIWDDARDFVMGQSDREEWVTEVTHTSGNVLLARMAPLPRNATLVGFSRITHDADTNALGLIANEPVIAS